MAYTVQVKRSALKALQAIAQPTQSQVRTTIDSLAENPRPSGAKPLKGGKRLFRIRVRDYRIIYRVEDDRLLVLVVRIAHRGKAYRNL